MSKIEEALKKAKNNREGSSGLRVVSNDNKRSVTRDLVSLNDDSQNVASLERKSSAKEIALMQDDKILENKQLSELKIIYAEMSDNKVANTYRELRTKIIQKTQGKNFIGMITSCVPGNESSSAALNLATAFSFDESKTSLLIDCNLNKPKLDGLLGVECQNGLTDYLENEDLTIESIIHKTGIKRVRMLPAGAPKEIVTEYFTSIRMRQLMSNLLNRYSDRYIFIDSAPITDSADTRILVELCDFVILVVPYGKATIKRIKDAADAIGKDKLFGIVFNEIPGMPNIPFPGGSDKKK